MTSDIMSNLTRLAERQATGRLAPPASPTRSEQIAEHLIRDEAARPTLAGIISDMIVDRVRWPEHGGTPIVLTKAGQPDLNASVADLIGEMRSSFPEAFAGGPTTASKPAPATLTAKAIAERDARKASTKAAADMPNPFAPATRNLTQQAILLKKDPAKAARLKAEAGA